MCPISRRIPFLLPLSMWLLCGFVYANTCGSSGSPVARRACGLPDFNIDFPADAARWFFSLCRIHLAVPRALFLTASMSYLVSAPVSFAWSFWNLSLVRGVSPLGRLHGVLATPRIHAALVRFALCVLNYDIYGLSRCNRPVSPPARLGCAA